jgi:hypothetical protein
LQWRHCLLCQSCSGNFISLYLRSNVIVFTLVGLPARAECHLLIWNRSVGDQTNRRCGLMLVMSRKEGENAPKDLESCFPITNMPQYASAAIPPADFRERLFAAPPLLFVAPPFTIYSTHPLLFVAPIPTNRSTHPIHTGKPRLIRTRYPLISETREARRARFYYTQLRTSNTDISTKQKTSKSGLK